MMLFRLLLLFRQKDAIYSRFVCHPRHDNILALSLDLENHKGHPQLRSRDLTVKFPTSVDDVKTATTSSQEHEKHNNDSSLASPY
jgi:hypothetical protein